MCVFFVLFLLGMYMVDLMPAALSCVACVSLCADKINILGC